MTKKVFSKAIAAILVAAMCMVAVFAGTVSAATQRSATYAIVGTGYDWGAKDSFVTATVTFSSDDAFVAGSFDISAPGLKFNDCSAGQNDMGVAPLVKISVLNNRVLFAGFTEDATNSITSYKSLTLVLTFTINDKSLFECAKGDNWTVSLSNVNITNEVEDSYDVTDNSVASTKKIHVHNYTGGSNVNNIKTQTCSVCGDTHAEVVSTTGFTTNSLADTKQANVTFTATGDTVLNALLPKSSADTYYDAGAKIYFIYTWTETGSEGENVEKSFTSQSTGTSGDYYVFPCGRNGGIARLARNVTGYFVTVNGSTVTVSSAKWEYSIKTYAETLAAGSNAAASYAKALLNYGWYTSAALGYTDEVGKYTSMPRSISDYSVGTTKKAGTSGTDGNWNLETITVTTGFKPKMNIKFNADTISNKSAITIKVVYGGSDVYYKEIATSTLTDRTYSLSDIPTKYIADGNIVISTKSGTTQSGKQITYSYKRYAYARISKTTAGTATDGPVFQALINWSHYLDAAF